MHNHEEETGSDNTGHIIDGAKILLAAATVIRGAAMELDYLRRECGTPEQRAESQKHINALHDLAEMLCPELYKPPASLEHKLPDCGDPATGQPCRNASPAQCGECPGIPAIGSLCHEG